MGRPQNTGQICCAIKRAYVHESIYDEFVAEISKAALAAKMGDGFAADTEFGPLNNEMQVSHGLQLHSLSIIPAAAVS